MHTLRTAQPNHGDNGRRASLRPWQQQHMASSVRMFACLMAHDIGGCILDREDELLHPADYRGTGN